MVIEMRNEFLLKDVDEVFSFGVEGDMYDLDKVNFTVAKKLIGLMERLNRLEKENKIIIIMRGFSFRDRSNSFSLADHERFKESELNKFFIVGQKGADYLREQEQEKQQLYTHNMQSREQLAEEIKNLYEEANQILREKQGEEVNGQIDPKFSVTTPEVSLSQLQYNKLFLTAFLHNVGRRWSGKPSSPLLSATYGKEKKETAKRFATNARGQGPRNNGFIILGYIPIDNSGFEKLTNDLNRELEDLGVLWYEDKHTEVMLLDGIMPHRIIGLFEIDMHLNETFILNPWLREMFLENRKFYYKRGIEIDQTRFDEYARDLRYGAYVSEIDGERYNRIFEEESYHSVVSFE